MSDEWRTNVRAALVRGTGTSHPQPVVFVPHYDVDDPRDLLWEDSTYAALVTDQMDVQDADQAVREWLDGQHTHAVYATTVYRFNDVTDLGPWESTEQAVALAEAYRARKAARRAAGKKGAATRKQREEEAKRQQRQQEAEARQEQKSLALAQAPRIEQAVKGLREHLGESEVGRIYHLEASVTQGSLGISMFVASTEVSNEVAEVLLAGLAALNQKTAEAEPVVSAEHDVEPKKEI